MPTPDRPGALAAHGRVAAGPGHETPVQTYLDDLHRRLTTLQTGALANYIPELARVDPLSFGIAIATPDGHVYEVGNTDECFTIQSVSKPFTFGVALDDRGVDEVLAKVGVEPSGDAFNAIVFDQLSGRPFNPMVNAGAIVTSGLVAGSDRAAQLGRILSAFADFIGHEVEIDEDVFESERVTGHRNRAIAHLMRGHEMLDDDVEGILDLYFRQCSIRVSCRDLAVMAGTLANRGVNPLTGDRALEEQHVAHVLSVMSTCGMYDYAGEWVYRVGMPAKSGVSGGLLAVLPGQLGIGVFSPLLDARGNSVRGIAVCEEIATAYGLHLLTPHSSVRSSVRRTYRGNTVRSKRFRAPAERVALDDFGDAVRVYELQGDLFFGSVELLTRVIVDELASTKFVVIDFKRIGSVDNAAIGLLADLCRIATAADASVLLAHVEPGSGIANAFRLRQDSKPGGRCVEIVADIDAALDWCESQLLHDAGAAPDPAVLIRLADHELLAGIDPLEFDALEALVRIERFEAGDTVFEQGDESDALYLLAAGCVEVLLPIDAEQRFRRLATVSPGVAFGEMAAIDGAKRSATARATEDAVCYVLEVAALDALCAQHPNLAIALHRNLARVLAGRLRQANEEISSLQS